MKNKDKIELHTKTENELLKMLKDAKEDLFMRKLDNAQNKLKNTRDLFSIRKKIAILLTILKEKELMKNG
jgi:ribosomal protein L29